MSHLVISEQVEPFGQCVMCLSYFGVHSVWLLMTSVVEHAWIINCIFLCMLNDVCNVRCILNVCYTIIPLLSHELWDWPCLQFVKCGRMSWQVVKWYKWTWKLDVCGNVVKNLELAGVLWINAFNQCVSMCWLILFSFFVCDH